MEDNVDVLLKYFKDLSDKQIEMFKKAGEVYREINKNVNLISRKDIDNLYLHHMLHSLSIVKWYQFSSKDNIVDVGTGGGFPGIPLAIYFTDVRFTLIDSIHKKINSVNIIVDMLGLKNVKTICCRSEDLKEKYDIILGRGVSKVDLFIKMVKNFIKKNTKIIYLNGISDDFNKGKSRLFKDIFDEEYFETKKITEIDCGML